MMQVLGRIYAHCTWFARGVLGADKYQKYLAHHRGKDCSKKPMTEREFWQDYYDRQGKNPASRCC
ncbi:MAG: YbdD/YjiX family protein [Rothia sp. (in: high G+C Gram-positive bacteria)]|nr:YbdD/YjiX family protein [Rothia sp. (in: high G+C Gram-positive bacteria)]